MSMRRYTLRDELNHSYFQMPRFLFHGKFATLSNDARMLYGLLRDRLALSSKNAWFNLDGEIYLFFSREKMMAALGLSRPSVTKAMKALREMNLVQELKQGQGKANRIYLMVVDAEPLTEKLAETEDENKKNAFPTGESILPPFDFEDDCNFQKENILPSRGKQSFPQEVKNLSASNTELNYTENSNLSNPSIHLLLSSQMPITKDAEITKVKVFVKYMIGVLMRRFKYTVST